MADPGRVRSRRLAWVLVLVPMVAACGSPDVSRSRVEAAFGTTFGNLYATGRPGVTPSSTGASATCDRGGATVADEGAGDDWACLVSWVDPVGRLQQAAYGVQVRPDGCWKADAEAAAAAAGVPRAFDGCTGAA